MSDSGVSTTSANSPPGLEVELPPQSPSAQRLLRTLIEWLLVAACALALALLIRTFFVQAYYIPSGSMESTLQKNDRVLVNKLSYRFGDVQRGDVIVFSKPENAPGEIKDFIKRVVALPGETISFANGRVFINGERYNEPYLNNVETFINGRPMDCANRLPSPDLCLVPEETVFVMGDNRVGSTDSRSFGPIEIDSIVGRAFIKLWPPGDVGFL